MRRYVCLLITCIAVSFCDAQSTQKQLPDPAPARLPPISLNVKDATLQEVAKALGDATGKTVVTASAAALARRRQAGEPEGRYTLNVTGQPFWEVFRQLNEQHTIRLVIPRTGAHEKPPDMFLMPDSQSAGPGSLWRQHKIVIGGDYLLQMSSISRSGSRACIVLDWAVTADPMLVSHIARAEFPPLTHIVDDRGDEMKYLMPQGVASTNIPPRGGVWPVQAELQVPTNGATKIVSLQGSFSMYESIPDGAGETRKVTIPFEIKDIPLPQGD